MNLQQIGIGIIFGMLIAFIAFSGKQASIQQDFPTITIAPQPTVTESISFGRTVFLKLPAVNKDGQGVLAELSVEADKGDHKVFIAFSDGNPLLSTDTQNSILTAMKVGERVAGRTTQNYNLYYTISTESQSVGGRSAGAAFTIATISALTGQEIKDNVLITGTIEEDGTIGKVGSVYEKALALKNAGFKTLLVPVGENTQEIPKKKCVQTEQQSSSFVSCTTELTLVDIQKETGVQVIQVAKIRDAMDLMLK